MVEASYVVDGSAAEWGARVLDAADQSLGGSLGGFSCEFRLNPDGAVTIDRESTAIVRQQPEKIGAILDGLNQAPPDLLALRLPKNNTATRCLLTSEVDPEFKLSYRRMLSRDGIHDGVNVLCVDLDRTGFLLSLGIPDRSKVTSSVRRNLRRIATHMLAALRLRRRLGAAGVEARSQPAPPPLESAAALLSPRGVLLHATGEASLADARRALTTAVMNVERARKSSRHDAREALQLWRGLVSARWTLVDQIDARGTRYIVARENSPGATDLPKLTHTERCVVAYAARGFSMKEIAYTLGLADTTVRVLMMRAVRRSGLRNRNELLVLAKAAADRERATSMSAIAR
jgi:DNA-binding CsgD family transcriptional regulator